MKKIMCTAFAVVTSVNMMAQTVYQKVATTPADWTGTYLIVCESQNVAFNGAADEDGIDAKGTGAAIITDIVISNGEITGNNTLDNATFTISGTEDADWPWAIQSASGLFIGHKDTLDNGLSAETTLKNKCKHTLMIDANGNLIATPKWSVSEAYNLQYNDAADQLRFRYFKPGKKNAVQIYKAVVNPTATEIIATPVKSRKCYENGQLVIIRDGKKYSVLGEVL